MYSNIRIVIQLILVVVAVLVIIAVVIVAAIAAAAAVLLVVVAAHVLRRLIVVNKFCCCLYNDCVQGALYVVLVGSGVTARRPTGLSRCLHHWQKHQHPVGIGSFDLIRLAIIWVSVAAK